MAGSNAGAPIIGEVWPPLPLAEWRETYETLHRYTQIVGKIRLALSPKMNHWWQVPLYVSAWGLTTSPIPYGGGAEAFEIELDFTHHELVLRTSWDERRVLALEPRPVAEFYRDLMATLRTAGIEVGIWDVPVEIPGDTTRFGEDRHHASYDPDAAYRFWRVLLHADSILKEFRGRFTGKGSPVQFFWGSFDFAVSRFSGRPAPPRPGADVITREAYSDEVISAGFWPGTPGIADAAFYTYAAPEPEGFSRAEIRPAAAFYEPRLSEFILPYEAVRTAEEPRETLLDFLQSVYEAGAGLGNWDRARLERPVLAPRVRGRHHPPVHP